MQGSLVQQRWPQCRHKLASNDICMNWGDGLSGQLQAGQSGMQLLVSSDYRFFLVSLLIWVQGSGECVVDYLSMAAIWDYIPCQNSWAVGCLERKLIIIQQQNRMGNEQCPDCKNDMMQTQAYGNYQVLCQNHQYYAVVQKIMQADQPIKCQVLKELQARQAINCAHLAKLHNFTLADEPYGFKLTMFYQYIPKSLRHRLEEMKDTHRSFTEREIFAVLYGVEAGLQILAKHKIKHCCINLDTILCKNSVYKITDVSSTTYLTSYDLAIKGNRNQFLSERLLERLAYQSLHPIYAYQDDLFSLGIVALVLGTQQDPADFYVWQNNKGTLNRKLINDSIRFMEKKYSSRLSSKIKALLNEGNEDNDRSINSKQLQIDSEMSKIMVKGVSYNSTTLSPQKSINAIQM